jgi:hydrogenase maturation factor
MFGKIIDIDNTDAFINFLDGTTMDVSVSRLPKDSKVGDTVDLNIGTPTNMLNDKMIDFF